MLTDQRGEIGINNIIGNFDTPLSTRATSSRQKSNEETLDSNYMLDQMDLRDI